jgi:hypothetical protein
VHFDFAMDETAFGYSDFQKYFKFEIYVCSLAETGTDKWDVWKLTSPPYISPSTWVIYLTSATFWVPKLFFFKYCHLKPCRESIFWSLRTYPEHRQYHKTTPPEARGQIQKQSCPESATPLSMSGPIMYWIKNGLMALINVKIISLNIAKLTVLIGQIWHSMFHFDERS